MAKKTTIKRIKSNNKNLETQFATAQRLLREARAHLGAEMLGDSRYVGAEGWDDEPVTQWFAEVDSLVGPAFPGGGVQASENPLDGLMAALGDECDDDVSPIDYDE